MPHKAGARRVGGLVAALALGATLWTGTGVAWADESGGTDGATTSSATDDATKPTGTAQPPDTATAETPKPARPSRPPKPPKKNKEPSAAEPTRAKKSSPISEAKHEATTRTDPAPSKSADTVGPAPAAAPPVTASLRVAS